MDLEERPYRLKSARRKKRFVKKDFDKMLIRLSKRKDELRLQKKLLPMVPLDIPYQRGWKRFFVLSDQMKRDPNVDFYQQLLDKINTVRLHYDRSFKVKKKKKRRYGVEVMPQSIRAFCGYEWSRNRLELSDEEKLSFVKTLIWSSNMKNFEESYTYAHPSHFVLKIVANMVTHVKQADQYIEQELSWIDNYIKSHQLYYRMFRLTVGRSCGWHGSTSFEQPKYINKLKNKPLYAYENAYMDYKL